MGDTREGRVAIVTGGGQGIGKAIVQRLLSEGMTVVIADNDKEAGDEAAAEFAASGRVTAMAVDVGNEANVAHMVDETIASFRRIDALVNNAGIARHEWGPVEQLSLADWNRVISTNLTGVFLCCKHAAPHLRAAGGAIVNIASTRALQSEPDSEAYAASKGGVVSLTHALALSLGPEVRVNCISPGWIAVGEWKKKLLRRIPELSPQDHAQHPVGRVGKPEDVAEMVCYLLSAAAGFVTGQNLVIDGGMTRKMIYVD